MQSYFQDGLHVAVIMDGNGRWAARRGWPRTRGHEAGVEAIRRIAEAAPGQGVDTLSLYAFSADNWRRPEAEVGALMGLLRLYLRRETARLVRDGIRLTVFGRRDRLPEGLAEAIGRAEEKTAAGTRLHLRIAVDYSARAAILAAATQAAARRKGENDNLGREEFQSLVTGDALLPDVDLLIRTSGEQRLSDFLLWESAYAELVFTECLWPDFGPAELADALAAFQARDRRFGGLTAPGAAPVAAV